MLSRRLAALVAASSLVMVGLAPWSQAEPTAAGAQRAAHEVEQVGIYIRAVMGQEIAAYVETVRAAEWDAALASAAAFVRSQYRRVPAARPPTSRAQSAPSAMNVAGGGGSCYDQSYVPAYIVTRESGGSPTAMNPSGAYGCFQIMPYVWSAACGDLSRDVAGQIECARRISNNGTNLQPWALTR